MRPGEAFALKWETDKIFQSDGEERPRWGWVDLDEQMVYVRATLARVGVNKGEASWKLMPPKTENSERDIPINDETVAALRTWRIEQKKEQMKAGPVWQRHGFVFTSEVGTPIGDNVRRVWTAVMRAADGGKGDLGSWAEPGPRKRVTRRTKKGRRSAACSLGPKPEPRFTPRFCMYALRHTMISLNFLGGMELGLLSRRAGHASHSFTFDRYGRGVKATHTKAVTDNTMRRWTSADST